MWARIYLGVLAAGVLAVGFFTYYSWGWLESIGRPEDAIAGYENTAGVAWAMLCLCSIVLLFLACGVMWARGRAWALWVTFAYFAAFVAISGLYLEPRYWELRQVSDGVVSVIAVLTIAGAAVPVLALQYLIIVLRQKFHRASVQPTIDLDAEDYSPGPDPSSPWLKRGED